MYFFMIICSKLLFHPIVLSWTIDLFLPLYWVFNFYWFNFFWNQIQNVNKNKSALKYTYFKSQKDMKNLNLEKKKIISAPRYHGGQIVSKKFSIFFYYSYSFVHVCLFLGGLEYYSRLYCFIGQKQASAFSKNFWNIVYVKTAFHAFDSPN